MLVLSAIFFLITISTYSFNFFISIVTFWITTDNLNFLTAVLNFLAAVFIILPAVKSHFKKICFAVTIRNN
jgi:hypothetical protein